MIHLKTSIKEIVMMLNKVQQGTTTRYNKVIRFFKFDKFFNHYTESLHACCRFVGI